MNLMYALRLIVAQIVALPGAALVLGGEKEMMLLTKSNEGVAENSSTTTSYTHTNCQGNSNSCNLGSTWPSWSGCGIGQWSYRCHQANLATAQSICTANSDCMGITRDNAGYEPRTGPSIGPAACGKSRHRASPACSVASVREGIGGILDVRWDIVGGLSGACWRQF